jgi:hypothetical protein
MSVQSIDSIFADFQPIFRTARSPIKSGFPSQLIFFAEFPKRPENQQKWALLPIPPK